ncbi:11195_t:CDS:2 [Paraglomus occultum]|uniref:11195_t:CDS:1 n=1 Tax=Paraglomus occultum TaxID=144539 RepID=A0A9N9B9W7_9GLOM|nr:11195_t:CDS:2 [Paraglomus occultum]
MPTESATSFLAAKLHDHPLNVAFRAFLAKFPLKSHRPIHRSPHHEIPTLYVWGNKTGQLGNQPISFDFACLRWQVWLLIIDARFDVKNCNEPLMSPSGKLPFLLTPNTDALIGEHIEEFLKQSPEHQPDLNIPTLTTDNDISNSKAFVALADTKLRNALLYYYWCEALNFEEVTSKLYGAKYPKPLNWIILYQMKSAVVKELLTRKPVLDREEIYQEAEDALKAISTLLADHNYFFGRSSPSFLDAVIFSYVHPILSNPTTLVNNLTTITRRYKNLVEFSDRMKTRYFAKTYQ